MNRKNEHLKRCRFKSFVARILSAKPADPQADTSALEAEMDGLVYGLYGVTGCYDLRWFGYWFLASHPVKRKPFFLFLFQ
jgi:hypothetical protein